MNDMKNLVCSIIRHAFGSNSNIVEYRIMVDKATSLAIRVVCDQLDKPLFLKVEKGFQIPGTLQHLTKRELRGTQLCSEKGIPVPAIISSDEKGSVCGNRWILEEFIQGKLLSEYTLDAGNTEIIRCEFESLFQKLLSIKGAAYGDTFDNGPIGKHATWGQAVSRINGILLNNCDELNVFDKQSKPIVRQALQKALSMQKHHTKPAFFHYDLLAGNVFAVERDGEIHIDTIIDFGLSMFAPLHYVEYMTRKYTDIPLESVDVAAKFGFDEDEIESYEILRIEPVVLLHALRQFDHTVDPYPYTQAYIDKCKDYIK